MVVLLSFFPITYKYLADTIKPLGAIEAMFIVSFIIATPMSFVGKKSFQVSWTGWFWISFVAILAIAGNWAFNVSIRLIDTAVASSVQRSELIVTPLLAALILKEKLNQDVIVAVLASIAGISIIQFSSQSTANVTFLGIVNAVLSAMAFSSALVLTKIALRYCTPVILNAYRLMLMAVIGILIPGNLALLADASIITWFFAFLCSVCGPIGTRLSMTYAVNYFSLSKIAIFTTVSPILTGLWQFLFFGLLPSGQEILGSSIILSGIFYMVCISRSKPA